MEEMKDPVVVTAARRRPWPSSGFESSFFHRNLIVLTLSSLIGRRGANAILRRADERRF